MLTHSTLSKTALAVTLCAAAVSCPGLAQAPPPTILRIDTANVVLYLEDTADPSKFATDPNVTTPMPPKNFFRNALIGTFEGLTASP